MKKLINLTGKTFGKLTVLKRIEKPKNIKTGVYWLCKCECGREHLVSGGNLKSGQVVSCGCYMKQRTSETQIIDLTKKRFGRLVVKYQIGRKNKFVVWHCVCDCGVETDVVSSSLLGGVTKSCGCYSREKTSERQLRNLIGQRFGKLVVEHEIKERKNGRVYWRCICDCGNEKDIYSGSLLEGKSRSCGCVWHKPAWNYVDLTGKRFGKLIALEKIKNHKRTKWLCQCDCGNKTEIWGRHLLRGDTQSCGCISESFISTNIKRYCLKNHNAKTEYNICKNPITNRYLPYDIYIYQGKNRKLNGIYIEINGVQHYEINNWHVLQSKRRGTTPETEFENQRYKDKLKKNFAKKNGIYIEIDLRKIKTTEEAIKHVENMLNL